MKCKWTGATTHRTKDQASPAAIKALQVARFSSDHSAVCNCMRSGGKMKSEDCDGLTVYNGDNVEVARFTGKQFRGHQAEDGSIVVFGMPSAKRAATSDKQPRGECAGLRAMNAANARFWAKR